MTTPKMLHDATTPTEHLTEFIISDLLCIAILAKYFFALKFPLLQSCINCYTNTI